MNIRKAAMQDLSEITAVEAECFPPAEAASEKDLEARLAVYPNHFWLLEDNGRLVGFIDGMVTDEQTIRDEMFENPLLHNESGSWQAIFGVNTIPEYRKRGCAAKVMEEVIKGAKVQNTSLFNFSAYVYIC